MKRVFFIVLLSFFLFSCSSETIEIQRQEIIISDFLEKLFDLSKYKNSPCSENSGYTPQFYSCVREEFSSDYSDIMDEGVIDMLMASSTKSDIMRSIMGDSYSVSYELLIPESLDFPNVFQVKVSSTLNGEYLEYYINIKVVGNKITQIKETNY